jgi:hypothetical protein
MAGGRERVKKAFDLSPLLLHQEIDQADASLCDLRSRRGLGFKGFP